MSISIDISNAIKTKNESALQANLDKAKQSLLKLQNKTGKGSDFLGWINLPTSTTDTLVEQIITTAKKVKSNSDVLVVIGIGGSYLGSKAIISSLTSRYFNHLQLSNDCPEIYFAGTDLSAIELDDLIKVIGVRDFSINIISKSGTTTEPAIAFRVLKHIMSKKYTEEELNNRIIATTDKSKGALKKQSTQSNWESYIIPDDVGGRFSVLTPVGLLPIAVAGIDIKDLLAGAKQAEKELNKINKSNLAIIYAATRNTLYQNGKNIEILANYEPRISMIAAWWKQLFGESEGKEGKGIFPASVDYTCDLHSMGQYIQEGPRNLFETLLLISNSNTNLNVPFDEDNHDNLNYLAGKDIDFINKMAAKGTLEAHTEGGVPNIIINIPSLTPFYIGYLIYFFELACGISAYMLDVNPFDQPGVEAYKAKMFKLLGKPN